MQIELIDAGGVSLVTASEPFTSIASGESAVVRFEQAVPAPALWSAEHPNLYTLLVTQRDAEGNVSEAIRQQIGFREVEISGGRLTLGLGAGWCEPEFRAFGFPFDRRVSRFEEALTIIGGLIHQGHVDFHGQFHFAHDCELRPRGPRPRGLPILIGATAGDRMMRLAASHADTWNRDVDGINPGFEPYSKEDLAAWRPRIDAVCAGVGRDPATLSRSAHVFVDLPGSPGRPGFGALAGEPAEIAAGLLTYAQAGFDHLQLWVEPNTAAGVAALAPILAELDQT